MHALISFGSKDSQSIGLNRWSGKRTQLAQACNMCDHGRIAQGPARAV